MARVLARPACAHLPSPPAWLFFQRDFICVLLQIARALHVYAERYLFKGP